MQNIHHTPSRAGRAPPVPPKRTTSLRPERQPSTRQQRHVSTGPKRQFSTRSTQGFSLVLDPEQASDYLLWDNNLRASYSDPRTTRASIDITSHHHHPHPNIAQRHHHHFDAIVEEDELSPMSPQSFPPRPKNRRSKKQVLQRWLVALDRFVEYVKEKLDPEEERMAWKLRELEKEMIAERQRGGKRPTADDKEMRRQLHVAAAVARAERSTTP